VSAGAGGGSSAAAHWRRRSARSASSGTDKVRIALTVDGHAPVRYPVAVVSDSRQKTVARDFAAYLTTPAVQEVLGRFGFGRP